MRGLVLEEHPFEIVVQIESFVAEECVAVIAFAEGARKNTCNCAECALTYRNFSLIVQQDFMEDVLCCLVLAHVLEQIDAATDGMAHAPARVPVRSYERSKPGGVQRSGLLKNVLTAVELGIME